MRVICVVADWIATERAHCGVAAMTPEQRAAEEPLSEPADVRRRGVDLVRDEPRGGRVVTRPAASHGGGWRSLRGGG